MNVKNCISLILIIISVAALCPIVCGSNAKNFLSGVSGGADVVKGLVNAKVTRPTTSTRPTHTPFPNRKNDHRNLYDVSGIQKVQPMGKNAAVYNQKGSTKAPDLVKMIESHRKPAFISARNAHSNSNNQSDMLNTCERKNYGWLTTQSRNSNYKRTHPNSLNSEIYAGRQHVMPQINHDLMPYRFNMSESMYMVKSADLDSNGFVGQTDFNRSLQHHQGGFTS